MATRPVPRNIDKPNRMAEYVLTFLTVYYSIQFMFYKPLISLGAAMLACYFVYKATLNKPEGLAFRVLYRMVVFGGMIPNAKKVPKFEI